VRTHTVPDHPAEPKVAVAPPPDATEVSDWNTAVDDDDIRAAAACRVVTGACPRLDAPL
jgi:hypothetical protein